MKYYVAGIPVSDELYHHGILGQKWGIRRYQNLDGSLTPAGREREICSDISNSKGSGYVKRQFGRYAVFGDQNNYFKAEREVRKQAKELSAKTRGMSFEDRREAFRELARNNEDKLVKALIEDLGYDGTESNINWVKSQPWYWEEFGPSLSWVNWDPRYSSY